MNFNKLASGYTFRFNTSKQRHVMYKYIEKKLHYKIEIYVEYKTFVLFNVKLFLVKLLDIFLSVKFVFLTLSLHSRLNS